MEELFQQVTNGLAIGGVYALVALGYTMVYGVLRLINFAHGELFTLGAYLGFTFLTSAALGPRLASGWGLLALALLVAGLVAVSGALLERAAYRPLREAPRLSAVVSALGASIFLQNALMLVWGARFQVYPDEALPTSALTLGGTRVPVVRLAVILVSLALMALLWLFVNRTRMGTAIRAVALDRDAARLCGVDVDRVVRTVFLVGPALGGVAGLMVGLTYGQIGFTMGWSYGMKAFTAAILGGIGNVPGAMLGGFLLGLAESLGSAYVSSAWKDAIAFVVLIVVLLVRPTGILGERVAEKA